VLRGEVLFDLVLHMAPARPAIAASLGRICLNRCCMVITRAHTSFLITQPCVRVRVYDHVRAGSYDFVIQTLRLKEMS
jgi:hypothetical protein